jgi:16S rRNA (cytidine1402-2'-O)-methyltransferase
MIQKSFADDTAGKLYLIPTPIGNLEDMTIRSLNVLKSLDVLLAEDTRNTQKLLNHFEIKLPQISFHEHNAHAKIPEILDMLRDGKKVGQVSDAGMPSISDPGHDLVVAAVAEGLDVIALPGASAGITALIASGIAPQPHIFYGFLPRKKSQQKAFFETKLHYPETQIFYESPFRVEETLENMLAVYGDRRVALVRELTKKFEEYRRGPISEVVASLASDPIKGECLIIVEGFDGEAPVASEAASLTPVEDVQARVAAGAKPNQAIKQVAKERGLERQSLYNDYHNV